MTLYRLIAPQWLMELKPQTRRVLEGRFSPKQIAKHNADGYNIYYLPNTPSQYSNDTIIDGSQIDTFEWVFCDMDLKDGAYPDKDSFLIALGEVGIFPSKIIDSGNGVHAYWKVSSLDAMSYLRFQRRLMKLFKTDEAVGQLFQLMRHPGTMNTKKQGAYVPCELLLESWTIYTAEELDRLLPPITLEDEAYCQLHYDKTYNLNQDQQVINEELPAKFHSNFNVFAVVLV